MSHGIPTAPAIAAASRSASPRAGSVDRTRDALRARLADAPAGDILCEYFERGKMLRAQLVFASSAAVGGDPDEVAVGAEAIELLHAASLFHDDIVDGAAERRGLASLHERLGVGRALVVGDDLLLRAFAALGDARACHPPTRVLEATDALNQLARACCRGQFAELCADRWISEEQYLAIVRGKTAAPFIAAGLLGVVLGGGTSAHAGRIRVYAEEIGVAFQIGDDLLDLIGEPGMLGKPVGNSVAQGRPMLPLIYLRQVDPDLAAGWQGRVDRGRPQAGAALLDERGVLTRVRNAQRAHVDAALAAISQFPVPAGVHELRALAARATSPVGVT